MRHLKSNLLTAIVALALPVLAQEQTDFSQVLGGDELVING